MSDDLNKPTTIENFNRECQTREKLIREIKTLVVELEKLEPNGLERICDFIEEAKSRRTNHKPN